MTAVPPTPGGEGGIGVRRPRIDSLEKVTGATRYAADRSRKGLLHARVVPSLYAHARIRAVDATAALAVPGVVAVLTAEDLPITGRGDMRMFEPLARGEVVFAGQPVALVIAESEAAGAREGRRIALEVVAPDAERLDPVLDLHAAMDAGAPPARIKPLVEVEDDDAGAAKAAHAAVGGVGALLEEEDLSENVISRKRYAQGDVTSALAQSDVVAEGTFRTNWVYQAYMEPHAASGWLEPDGTLVVETSTQGTFYCRQQLAKIFGLPASQVRVLGAPLGGAFGSKVIVVEPLVAGAVLALHRPVRLALTRREDFAATNPASIPNATCARFRLLISDNVGNQATYTSANIAQVDSGVPTVSTPVLSESSPYEYVNGTQLFYSSAGSNSGSFTAAGIFHKVMRGVFLADVVAVIGSFDIVVPEIDR